MKILIVDDEADNRNLLESILSKYGQCKKAVNGMEAVRIFKDSLDKKEPFDFITMDVMMPEMNGHETLNQIRDLESTLSGNEQIPKIKVVMVSANCDYETILRALDQDCLAYIEKPVFKEKLIETMKQLGLIPKK